ncbi:sugar ABC transporter substrate-binding protein, partial [Acinetobacter baumannii]
MKIKSVLSGIALGLGVTLMSISAQVSAQSKQLVGVAMPTKSSARWIADGNNMVKVLKEKGYQTDLQYAEDDIPNQLSQI